MAKNIFIGDYKTFYKFFGGYARNTTLLKTKKYKTGVCACCGTREREIQSAHKRGFERSDLVKKFFYESVFKEENGVYYVDLNKFEKDFLNFSEDVSNFHFLCEKCHTKYDHGEIGENDLPHKEESIKTTTKTPKKTENTCIKHVYTSNTASVSSGVQTAQTVDYIELTELLRAIGKGTFKACYDIIANNYDYDREVIKRAIAKYGFNTTGKHYSINSINTKTTCSCKIFKLGWEKEALHLCDNI